MKSIRLSAIAALCGILCISGCGLQGKLGEPAPKLHIAEWVKGSPVMLNPEKIFVVEFWATWCPPCRQTIPHLTALQKKYQNEVIFIGITQEEPAVVRPFVESLGGTMDYTVAIDDHGITGREYMIPFKVNGIPHAFVIKDSKIIWHGHPMDGMAEVIEKALVK
ncbi:redoxin domain-containing protein [bacterium]|nr:redoxin domain-containing protein [bacterium]MCP5462818.1 redoxin domain-containing protein [bacterium]MCP5463295.1 redoxin domain-containing protein [bacterium]